MDTLSNASISPTGPAHAAGDIGTLGATIPMGLRVLAIVLRALFIGALVALTVRVSSPQSESFASVHETPSDLIRLALGGVSVDSDPSVHASQDGRGIQDLGLSRHCSRATRLGSSYHHMVMCSPCLTLRP
jgi:hypothetical protein